MAELFEREGLIEDLLDERDEILEMIGNLPPFRAQKDWHLTEQHILGQCLVEVSRDLLEMGISDPS